MKQAVWWLVVVALLLSACAAGPAAADESGENLPVVSSPPVISATATPLGPVRVWVNPLLPPALGSQLQLPDGFEKAGDVQESDLRIDYASFPADTSWVYVLAAPFPTIRDGVSRKELEDVLAGQAPKALQDVSLVMTVETKAMLRAAGFEVSDRAVAVLDQPALLESAWKGPNTWAILPFEDLEPRWKVLMVDGTSPLEIDFSIHSYSLTSYIGVSELAPFAQPLPLPKSNFDPDKMTRLLMTGVTALTRSTAARMDTFGVSYPGEKIQEWMTSADLTHISNEVSFNPECPLADFSKHIMHFCSRPEYIQLLDEVGVDIVELSGNHLVDWGKPAFVYSLDLYAERGWKVFAGGMNQEEARQAVFVEDHGNRLAFIGCNPAGPEIVWATETTPGVADCDLDWMEAQVRQLRREGYLPVVTFQYNESYGMVPGALQTRDFMRMAAAGAVVVSGSQAHHPQSMAFYEKNFVHFGLGNLFFDQMRMPDGENVPEVFDAALPVAGTRLEFLDRHIFYEGKYLGTQLLTAMLEDYAQPRPLTPEERAVFLARMFQASGWEPGL